MARPKNQEKSIKVVITAPPKMGDYLDELVIEEAYGNSRAEVAKNLVWRTIEELIHKGIIDRKPRNQIKSKNYNKITERGHGND